MFSKTTQTPKSARVYACTQLSILPQDPSSFFTPEYRSVASAGLNTGSEKYYFLDEENASKLLTQKGTNWCIYALDVPEQNIKITAEKVSIKGYQIKNSDIVEIRFHDQSPYKESKEKPSSSM